MILFQFPGIKGSTNAGEHKECILLNSVDLVIGRRGEQQKLQDTQRKLGFKFCDPIIVSRGNDTDTRELISKSLLCTIADAKIFHLETNNRCYLVLELLGCVINEIKISWHGSLAIETFYLTFKEINYRTIPLGGNPGGTGFNLTTGEGG